MHAVLPEPLRQLAEWLEGCGPLTIALSGGMDSSFLTAFAQRYALDRVMAATILSPLMPAREIGLAEKLCTEIGVLWLPVQADPLEAEEVRANDLNRCYVCKTLLFERIIDEAACHGCSLVVDGSVLDDLNEHRPGRRALRELGIVSPMLEHGIDKQLINEAVKLLDLDVTPLPPSACLATRFAYGEELSPERLSAVDRGEQYLREQGFGQLRLRVTGQAVRLELRPDEISRMLDSSMRSKVVAQLKALGFSSVSVDLAGYQSGSWDR